MKHTHAKSLALALLITMLGINTRAQNQPVKLVFWDNQQAESGLSQYQQTAINEFERANPNIKVEVVTVPYPEYQQRLLLAVKSGNAPDVSTVDQIWNAGFATGDAIEPLDDYVAKSATVKRNTFFKGAWDSAVYGGKVWGVPFNVDVWQFTFYNRALLSAAGVVPSSLTTWEGLAAAGKKLTDRGKGRFGVGLFGHKGEDTVVVMDSFIYSNGGSVLDASGKCALSQPEAVAALKYLASLKEYAPDGILNTDSGNMRELFLNGSLATEFWPALEQPTLQKSKLDWGFVNGTAPSGKRPVGTYGGWNLVIYKSSKNKEAAWKFIEFLTSKEVNGKVVDLIPANIAAATAFLRDNRRNPAQIMAHLNNARPRPLSPRYLDLSSVQQDMLQAVLNGTSVESATADACAKIDALR